MATFYVWTELPHVSTLGRALNNTPDAPSNVRRLAPIRMVGSGALELLIPRQVFNELKLAEGQEAFLSCHWPVIRHAWGYHSGVAAEAKNDVSFILPKAP